MMKCTSINLVVKQEPFLMTQAELKTAGYAFIPIDLFVGEKLTERGYLAVTEDKKDIFNDIPQGYYHSLVHCYKAYGDRRYSEDDKFIPWYESLNKLDRAWTIMGVLNQPRNPNMPMRVWTLVA